MKFDITNIDPKRLHDALVEFNTGKCDLSVLLQYDRLIEKIDKSSNIFNLYKGIGEDNTRLWIWKKDNGQILADSEHYDARNGKYTFLDAMLSKFTMDEILIIQKEYSYQFKSDNHRPQERMDYLVNLLKTAVEKENEMGTYWALSAFTYK